MDYRSISRLFVRTSGVLVLVYTATLIPESLFLSLDFAQRRAGWHYILWPWLPLVLVAALGVALTYFPSAATNLAARQSTDSEDAPEVAQLQVVVGFALGLYFVVAGVSDIAYAFGESKLFQLVNVDIPKFEIPTMHPRSMGRYLAGAVEMIAGLILLYGASGLVRLWRRIRGRDD